MASEGDCLVISFDFFYAKAGENVKEEETLVAMVMIDNKTGYLGVVPLSSKAQFDLLTKELIAFTSTLDYSSIQLRCDNEPTMCRWQNLLSKPGNRWAWRPSLRPQLHTLTAMVWQKTQFKESVVSLAV